MIDIRPEGIDCKESRRNKFHDQCFEVVHKCQRHSVLNSVFGKKDCFTKNKSAM